MEKNYVEREDKSVRTLKVQVRQRGGAKIKALIYTAILVAGIYSAYKIIPIYWGNYQLQERMQEQARFAVVNRYSDEQVRENVYKMVQELELPAKREDIKVSAGTSLVRISLDYTVPVDLGFYHVDLHFAPSSENKSLF
jgi:hypothetical protein